MSSGSSQPTFALAIDCLFLKYDPQNSVVAYLFFNLFMPSSVVLLFFALALLTGLRGSILLPEKTPLDPPESGRDDEIEEEGQQLAADAATTTRTCSILRNNLRTVWGLMTYGVPPISLCWLHIDTSHACQALGPHSFRLGSLRLYLVYLLGMLLV